MDKRQDDNTVDEQGTAQRRDQLLHRLLHTPPQPRPQRERSKTESKQGGDRRQPKDTS